MAHRLVVFVAIAAGLQQLHLQTLQGYRERRSGRFRIFSGSALWSHGSLGLRWKSRANHADNRSQLPAIETRPPRRRLRSGTGETVAPAGTSYARLDHLIWTIGRAPRPTAPSPC